MDIQARVPEISLAQLMPFLILTVAALAILALDALLDFMQGMTPRKRDRILAVVTGFSFIAAGFTFYMDILGAGTGPFFEGMFRADSFGNLGALVILFSALVFVVMSPSLIERRKLPAGELYALLTFSVTGMLMLAVANELITAFICIELLSLALYVMAGIDRRSRRSNEAAFKYFILGAFAAAFLVLGTAFLFGATGTTQLFGSEPPTGQLASNVPTYDLGMDEVLASGKRIVITGVPEQQLVDGVAMEIVRPAASMQDVNPMWVFIGFALVLVGLCFKLSLAPFHMWAPDVYEGASTLSAMFIATASKVAAFAFFIHLVEALSVWRYFPEASGFLIALVAAASILWGNLGAVVQTNIKRMLAYSSIAHGGYITVGIAAMTAPGVYDNPVHVESIRDAVLFYLFAYTLLNVIAFGVVAYLGREGEGEIANYRGLAKRHQWLAAAMAIAMISLIGLGIPATVGVWGKFFVFKEAIDAGLIWLAVIGVIGSAISTYYYLRVVVAMYMQEAPEGAPATQPSTGLAGAALAVTALMTLLFGVVPGLFFMLAR